MPASFDPYHRWLGIQPEKQLPDHYRLLGLTRFENDVEVIRDAAERQMAHVRRYAVGEHADDAKRILNELGGAKACLTDREKRTRYDATLSPQAMPQAMPTPHVSPSVEASGLLRTIADEDNKLLRIILLAGAIIVPLLCILAVATWVTRPTSEKPAPPKTREGAETVVSGPNDGTPRARSERSTTIPGIAEAPPREISNSLGMKLNLIPAGEFMMGSPASETGRADDEHQHRVLITQPFYMATTEVTQGQWQTVMKTMPWQRQMYAKEGSNFPATNVSWEDTGEFCRRLSATESRTYRLPTEAEWEYACRAGSTRAYSFGDSAMSLKDFAWFDGNAWNVKEKYAHRVGQNRANAYGLFDMHGNVWEWCADWYDENYYATPTANSSNPVGPASGSFRVNRGGGWRHKPHDCRSANRYRDAPAYRSSSVGFRVCSQVGRGGS